MKAPSDFNARVVTADDLFYNMIEPVVNLANTQTINYEQISNVRSK